MSEPIALTLRRLRQDEHVRALTREVHLRLDQLIQPCFVAEGTTGAEAVPGLTGVMQETPASLLRQTEADLRAGVRAFLLFGVPRARAARQIDWSFTAGQIQALKARFGKDIWLAADVCLCSSTPHGHCGVLNAEGDHLDNDASVQELSAAALAYAQAGADCVAPSDMMDGRVRAIRARLDREGFAEVPILSYAAKFASAFYGPFRDAAESAPQFGDRRSYQMDPANVREAIREMELDIEEGADMIMVKPALSYLDVIRVARENFDLPVAAYNVSGEYSMVKAASERGWIDGPRVMNEILTSIKRAGADLIITYHAVEFASQG